MNKSDLINSPIKEYERLLKMDLLIRNGNFPSVDYLAEKLEVTRRAVFRYRNILMQDFGAPLKLSKEYGGYYYEDPDFTISDITLNEHESLALHLAKRLSEMMLYGSNLYSSFSRGINSLTKRASKTTRDSGKKIADRIQFAFPHTDFGSTWNKYFEKVIMESLQDGTLLKFIIKNFTTDRTTEISALPLLFVMFENNWLLLCLKGSSFSKSFSSSRMKLEDFILFDISAIISVYEVKDSNGNKIRIKNKILQKSREGITDSVSTNEDGRKAHELWFTFSISFSDFKDNKEYQVLLNFIKTEDYSFKLTDNFLQEAALSGKGKFDRIKPGKKDIETLI
ncbi:HTH domain-containing protein [Treponema sp.]|uniref:helix-turn-helix transcriptional regulator n=1 Tax=Treponema sp. TaxID=166 RepID=UPI00298D78BE|nr:HTH domain-containing protein [Treponema sp.]MCQ2240033.1 HTH domain-containing protein [Treponema sp.]